MHTEVSTINQAQIKLYPQPGEEPVIVKGTNNTLLKAYAIANIYLSLRSPCKIKAIKEVRVLSKEDGHAKWGLREAKVFVEAVEADGYGLLRDQIINLF